MLIATKLNQTNAMLCKERDFFNANILKSIYYALFESHINYACIIWGKTSAQLTIATFSRKRHLELSILKSVMLIFITLKLLKLN